MHHWVSGLEVRYSCGRAKILNLVPGGKVLDTTDQESCTRTKQLSSATKFPMVTQVRWIRDLKRIQVFTTEKLVTRNFRNCVIQASLLVLSEYVYGYFCQLYGIL